MRCLNLRCDGEMILVLAQKRANPVTGKDLIEETWHCPECKFIFLRARPAEEGEEPFKLQEKTFLRKLGYL